MTVSSIILDLRGPILIITNPNISPDISSMTILPYPTVDATVVDICCIMLR